MTEIRKCPFCQESVKVYETLGRLQISCYNEACKIKPSTWLHAGEIYDVRKIVKYWNSAFKAN